MKKYFIITIIFLGLTTTLHAQNKTVDTLLETCGVLSAQGVYITYTSIGTLGDAYAYGVYDDETTSTILSEYIGMSEGVNEQLNFVLKSGILNSEDIGFVIELNNIYELLIAEADAFNKFIQTKDESYIHIYESNRTKAWNKISQLFELE